MLAEAEAKLADHSSRAGFVEAGAASAAAGSVAPAAVPAAVPAAAPAVSGGDAAPAEPEGSNSAAQPASHDAPQVKGMRRCGECSKTNGYSII